MAQLCRTMEGVKVLGVASKSKHEALQGSIDHLLERGSDYASEVRKYVFFFNFPKILNIVF